MTEAKDNFEKWFVTPLKALNADGDAAFSVLMITFPLLERYLREKSQVKEQDLDDHFYDEFHSILGAPTRALVPKLWHAYRNGLLHQATFSKRNRKGVVMPSSFITSDVELIEYDASDDAFYVNPKAFSEKVIEEIGNNFSVFQAAGSENHPLARVEPANPDSYDDGPTPSGVRR